jgi:hypothetical protein
VFSPKYCPAFEVRSLLEPWTERNGIAFSVEDDGAPALGIDVIAGEEPDHVIRAIVDRLADITAELSRLPEKPVVAP